MFSSKEQISYEFMLLLAEYCVERMKGKTGNILALQQLASNLNAKIESSEVQDLKGQYSTYEDLVMILKNIALCLTLIGLIAVIVKLSYSAIVEDKISGFFRNESDNSIQISKIKNAIDSITPNL